MRRAPTLLALAVLLLGSASPSVYHVDFLISAGHEGRPASCKAFPDHHCNLGAAGERAWTPVVANEATRVLRSAGYSVAREPADFGGSYDVIAAVFIHFDGSTAPCSSGASIGYPSAADRALAQRWHALYARSFPFSFQPDNFTDGLRNYYAYRQVHARKGALVLELGELSCPAQRAWLAGHLRSDGALIAQFLRGLRGHQR